MPVLFVTGGSRGIGAAVARAGAAEGYDVALTYADDASAAREVTDAIEAAGRRALAVRCDVAREADVVAAFEALDDAFGAPDVVVVNAGITGGFSRLDALDAHMLRRVLSVNVAVAFLCAREAVRRLSTQHGGRGGSIVNISSLAARYGGAGEWIHYAASKGAIDSLTVGLAREVAAEGIRVNAVAPGLVETELHAAAGAPDRALRLGPSIPMGRPAVPEEIAEGVLWLLSSASSYVTGAILAIGGGR